MTENTSVTACFVSTLGAVIVLLIWLYLTSFILFLGAEYNAALMAVSKEAKEISTTP